MNNVPTKSDHINPSLIKALLLITAFFAMLNETSMNVALSNFGNLFNVSVSTVQWLTTGFMLVTTIVVPVTAFILQRFTTRQIYFSAMLLLIVGAIVSGTAQIFGVLLAGRMMQAVGSSFLLNLLINTVLVLTPPHKRGAALGLVSLVVLFAPAISPTLSGLVMQTFGWRWLFFGVIPFFVITAIVACFALKDLAETNKIKIDLVSIILSAVAFGGILIGISNITGTGAKITFIFIPLLIGAASLVLFAWRQLHVEKPLLELRVLKYSVFTLGALMNVLSVMTVFGVIVLIPMYLERVLGLSAFVTGLVLLPGGLLNGFVSPIAGRIYDKHGPKPLIIPGFILMMIMSWSFSTITASTNLILIIIMDCCILTAAAMVMTPSQTNSLNQLPRDNYPHGTAIMNTMVQLAGSLGTAIYISILSVSQQHYLQSAGNVTTAIQQRGLTYGFNHAFRFGAFLLIAGLAISLFVKKSSSVQACEESENAYSNRTSEVKPSVLLSSIMKKDVYTVNADATLLDVMKIITDKKISGMPVMDSTNKIVGFISDGDIMRYFAEHHPLFSNAFSLVSSICEEDSFDKKLQGLMNLKVTDVAVKNIIAVNADDDLSKVCRILSENNLKKVPVMKSGHMVGIINRSNITKYAMKTCLEVIGAAE